MTRLSLSAIVLATLVSTALAAGEPSCEKSLNVMNQMDLNTIKHCKTFQGSITISKIGPTPSLRMEGIENLMGDLILSGNPDLLGFSAPNLKTVGGSVKVENHTILSKAEFPQLTQANSFVLSVLPALENIKFPAGLSKVGSMRIEDTRAPKIDGFKPETIGSFVLNNNNYMKSFDFSSVKQADEIMILGNNPALIFDASKLETLKTATILNLAQVQMDALTQVRSDLSFHENNFSSLKMDSLQSIGGTFTVVNNNKLTETSFKGLSLVSGALSIGNNSVLAAIEGFPSLAEIYGTCDLAGSFDSYALPALQDVRGGMRIQTTSSKLVCNDIERRLKGENIVKGTAWSCSASMMQDDMVPILGQNPSNGNNAKVDVGSKKEVVASGASALYGSFGLIATAGFACLLL